MIPIPAKEDRYESRKGGKVSSRDVGGATGGIANIILYGGGLYIVYRILKDWYIINSQSAAFADSSEFNWRPMTEQELRSLIVK